jgi:hypothetical protein
MNKPYLKPGVKKIEVTSQFLRMIDKFGFIEVFYEELVARRKIDSGISEESVFDDLNKEYFDVLGVFRYSSYDCFKQLKNKKP